MDGAYTLRKARENARFMRVKLFNPYSTQKSLFCCSNFLLLQIGRTSVESIQMCSKHFTGSRKRSSIRRPVSVAETLSNQYMDPIHKSWTISITLLEVPTKHRKSVLQKEISSCDTICWCFIADSWEVVFVLSCYVVYMKLSVPQLDMG